ncbi:MAG: precorrin-6y C5,15-methyltransferase (decarboxylating) subunit CbiE [Magnetococcus sp. XQGC-1]
MKNQPKERAESGAGKVREFDNPCWIVGVLDSGPDTLTPVARRLLEEADLVLGDPRFLQLFAPVFPPHCACRPTSGHLKEVPHWIEAAMHQNQRVVLLATGDPLFSGIAGHLYHKLPVGSYRVLPAPSTPQLAFARLGLPWTDARFLSVHARDGGEWAEAPGPEHPLSTIVRALSGADKLAILTSPANSPGRIARLLLHLGLEEHFAMVVAERLETPQERISPQLSPAQVAKADFAHPNVVIILRHRQEAAAPAPLLGLADACFLPEGASSGLITRREIRVIVLANLALSPDSIVWDIGAGSGSVGLEAARLVPSGWVYAVEKDPLRCRRIQESRARLQIGNYQLLEGRAPTGLDGWPDPDALFIGGSDGLLPELITLATRRLQAGGRLVITLVTLDNLSLALATLRDLGWSWQMLQVQVNHAQPILTTHRLVATAPVWILTARRGGEAEQHTDGA